MLSKEAVKKMDRQKTLVKTWVLKEVDEYVDHHGFHLEKMIIIVAKKFNLFTEEGEVFTWVEDTVYAAYELEKTLP